MVVAGSSANICSTLNPNHHSQLSLTAHITDIQDMNVSMIIEGKRRKMY
jgi:hypothetical protein